MQEWEGEEVEQGVWKWVVGSEGKGRGWEGGHGAEVFQWVILECRESLSQSVCTLLALAVKLILLSVCVD